ncbi:protein kinase domain-containing protein [Streptomyces sp. O3]
MSGRGADQPPTVPVPKGYRVGGWEVREALASGAFGSVYAARRTTAGTASPSGGGLPRDGHPHPGDGLPDGGLPDDGLPETAALKFLPTGTHTPRQLTHLRELAEREVDLLRRLRSPRLIRMYQTLTVDDPDHPELDGATVLVLEQATGSLDGLLAHSPTPDSGPALLAQICEGLHQLHHAGWIHGDLKPANVLLMPDHTTRLADFNMAAELDGNTHAYTPAFSTPDYTPPELLWADITEHGQQIRPTADIWAFGVLAHLVLTGSYPLPGGTSGARSEAAVRYARGIDELRLSPELPDAWRDIITDCLARTHTERTTRTTDTATLLRRVEHAADTPRSPRLPRLRPLRWRRPALALALASLFLGAATLAYTQRGDTVTYGYHDCPKGSVCFFSEPNGNGEMCSWEGDDEDWLAGDERCAWTRDRPVKSIFNNSHDPAELAGVAYYRGADFTPAGFDLTRDSRRTGCTSARSQGNLAGTYAPRSHRWVERC